MRVTSSVRYRFIPCANYFWAKEPLIFGCDVVHIF